MTSALKTLKQAYDKGYGDGFAKGRETGRAVPYPLWRKVGWLVIGAGLAALGHMLGGC